MGTGQRIKGMTRLAAVLVLTAGVGIIGSTGAGAATNVTPTPLGTAGDIPGALPRLLPPDPSELATTVEGTVKGVVEGAGESGSDGGSQPSTRTGAPSGSDTAPRPSSSPAAGGSASRTGSAPAGDSDTVVAADASVRDLLGACVRLTRSGVPARATVVVLDRNLIEQLSAVGLPLDRLLVPCPVGAASGSPAGSGGGTTIAAATTGAPAAAGTSGLLAFTGADIAPTVLLAGGLLALGMAFLRKAHALVEVREVRTNDA